MAARNARHWCFTHNNPTDNTEQFYVTEFDYDYLIIGHEVGASGTPHLQGYIAFKTKQRLTAIVKKVAGGHWIPADGSPKANQTYCSKGGVFAEYGELPKTGGEVSHDVWRDVHALARTGDTTGFFENHPQISFLHSNRFRDLVQHYQPRLVDLPLIDARWYMGKSGSGKSRSARSEFPGLYLKDANNKWWPDYNRQDTVLIDELSKNNEFYLNYLKTWADHYPFNAECKNGHTGLIRPIRIIVTTQYHWDEMTLDPELRAAIARRFKVRKFPEHVEEDADLIDGLNATFVNGQFDWDGYVG